MYFIVTQMLEHFFDCLENSVREDESGGHQHFLLFSQCFQIPFSLGSLTLGIIIYVIKS